ncbi:MAG: GDP-L-fucose synthase [Methylophaga sp.]|uniref:GDP-L-fucose synthase family protein n=1 Tax=Methylophaga sp. TaxID=2024840 RepID=UPI000C10A22A|nr:GDP-L-fucose synthase [Methylophaga sp.]MBL1457971.1 GDP-L-fucose synthase [Methylophaga sp.]
MNKTDKIYVAGHRGLVGSALVRNLEEKGYTNLLKRTHAELDLTDEKVVADFFRIEKPDYVFLAAAKVGGIHANNTYPAEFIRDNLAIQTNVIHQAYLNNVKRLLFLGSSCIYPKNAPQPLKEEYLLTGPLEETNRPYALAKIAGIEMCWSYNRQYGTQYLAAMPTNLYGPGDNYDLQNSHVIPALIRKFHQAKNQDLPEVKIWGTGTPRREFLHSDEMAEACIFLMQKDYSEITRQLDIERAPLINVGSGVDLTIHELASLIKGIVGYSGNLVFDTTKPDGTPRKLTDVSLIGRLGWHCRLELLHGLTQVYEAYRKSDNAITN